jgi:hypothetical protein
MKSRLIQRKATVKVSPETLQSAVQLGEALSRQWTQDDDPRLAQLAQVVRHLSDVLNTQPDQMQAEGMRSLEDYLDDAINPQVANQIQNEVNMIAKWRREATPGKVTEQKAPAAVPQMASEDKEAAGNDWFATDRDESGQPKAPEQVTVPRVAAKKKEKEAAPAPAAPAAAPAAAAPAPGPVAGSKGTLQALPTELILKIVEELPKVEGFEANKQLQDALIETTEILKARPVQPKEQPAAAPAPMPVAASSAKTAVTPPGISEKTMHELKSEYPGEPDKAYATAWKIHNEKKGSAIKAATAAFIEEIKKIAGGNGSGAWSTDQSKGDVVDGGTLSDVTEAHGKIDESPAKLDRPETVLPIKLAAMTAAKAAKEAEKIGGQLKGMYLEAKALTEVNDSRPVREAVEGIFKAGDMFDEAVKVFAKQQSQEESEEVAAEMKKKEKKSSLFGLSVAAAAE